MILLRSLTFGGAERQAGLLATALRAMGHDVIVVTFYESPTARALVGDGVQTISLHKRRRWDVVGFAARLGRVARSFRPDIIYGFLDGPNLVAIPLKGLTGADVVWGIRATAVEPRDENWLPRALRVLEARLARLADAVIVNSETGRELLLSRKFPPDRTHVVYNGIDTDRFRFDPVARAAIRDELSVDAATVLIGRIGRVHPMKDWDAMLRAFRSVTDELATARLVWVGSPVPTAGHPAWRLASELRLTDRVHWQPARHDIWRVYSALDVAVSSSAYGESFPNVVGEALSCGVPCVATDVGDSAAILEGIGIVVPPSSPQQLAQAIVKAARGPCDPSAAANRRAVAGRFSVDAMVEGTLSVFEAVRS